MINKCKISKTLISISIFGLLSGCSSFSFESKKTSYPHNACLMLKENRDWLESTYNTYKKWKVPISVQLAIIKHESSFDSEARPVRKNKWYEFGTNYASSARGYSQALDGTWKEYLQKNNKKYATRSSFKDSTDFIGWYTNNVHRELRISKRDAYNLYLAYHEGIGGYKKRSYRKKSWLTNYAKQVSKTSIKYSKQLNNCGLKL